MSSALRGGLVALLFAWPAAGLAASGMHEDDNEPAPAFSDVARFAEVYDYAVGGPDRSMGVTCAAATDGSLDDGERTELTALYGGTTAGWQGFAGPAACEAIRASAMADGPGFTELVDTGTPDAFAGRPEVWLFVITRFCGTGCGTVDHMTVIEEPSGYRPIWGVPRLDAAGEIVFDTVEGTP